MRLCRFETAGNDPALGVVEGEEVVDLSSTDAPAEPAAALDELGPERLAALATNAPRLPLADVRLPAPATPRKYLAIALNYRDHIEEMGGGTRGARLLQQAGDLRGRARGRGAHA